MNKHIPIEVLEYYNKYFDYNQETGSLTWKEVPKYTNIELGDEVGTINNKGYRKLKVLGRIYSAHRVIWFAEKGEEPNCIDHINGIKDDNRIVNLRNVSQQENCMNRRKPKNNKSGCVGVSYDKRTSKWYVQIYVNKAKKFLGYFSDLQEAIIVRKQAEVDYGYHSNHGK